MRNIFLLVSALLVFSCATAGNPQDNFQSLIEDSPKQSILDQYYRQFLKAGCVKIEYNEIEIINNKEVVINKGEIYYDGAALIALYENNTGSGVFNYISRPDGLYSWRPGIKNGKIFEYSADNLKQLLIYLVDASLIKMQLLSDYIDNKKNFTVSAAADCVVLTHNQFSIFAVGMTLNPLWLRDLRLRMKEKIHIIRILRPVNIENIPEKLFEIPKDVVFKKTTESYIYQTPLM